MGEATFPQGVVVVVPEACRGRHQHPTGRRR